jgi:hypothetical protein
MVLPTSKLLATSPPTASAPCMLRPLIICGSGARYSLAEDEVARFAESRGIPKSRSPSISPGMPNRWARSRARRRPLRPPRRNWLGRNCPLSWRKSELACRGCCCPTVWPACRSAGSRTCGRFLSSEESGLIFMTGSMVNSDQSIWAAYEASPHPVAAL